MNLYKYFKPSTPSETLAVEQNNLSTRENEKMIQELQSVEENKGKQQMYRIWTPTQTAEIGKHAAEHGNTSTVTVMILKYPGLKWQTVSDFKLAYLKLKKSKKAADSDITEIVKKKNWSPHFATQNLMKKVIETVTNLWLRGA